MPPRGEAWSLSRLAYRFLLPAVLGLALAAIAALAVVGIEWAADDGRGDSGSSRSILSDPRAMADPEQLVHAAKVRLGRAAGEAAQAAKLRRESEAASRQADALERELARVEGKEAARDSFAVKETERAKAAERRAQARLVQERSVSALRSGLYQEAKTKRDTFLRDERLAGKSKAEAHRLLNKERELFTKSFKLFDKELGLQNSVKRQRGVLHELQSKEDELMSKIHSTVSLKEVDSTPKVHSASLPAPPAHAKPERPLWGAREWPNYYYNALDSPREFAADRPRRSAQKADAKLDTGDDDRDIDSRAMSPQRCALGHPCEQVSEPHEYPAHAHYESAARRAEWLEERHLQQQRSEAERGSDPYTEPHEYPATRQARGRYVVRSGSMPRPYQGSSVGRVMERRVVDPAHSEAREMQMWQEGEQHPRHLSLQNLEAMNPDERTWLLKKLGIKDAAPHLGGGNTAHALKQFEQRVAHLEEPLEKMQKSLEDTYRKDVLTQEANQKVQAAQTQEENKLDKMNSAMAEATRQEEMRKMKETLEKDKQDLVHKMKKKMQSEVAELNEEEQERAKALREQEARLRDKMEMGKESDTKTLEAIIAVREEDAVKIAKLRQALDAAVGQEHSKVREMTDDMDRVVEDARRSEITSAQDAEMVSKSAQERISKAYKENEKYKLEEERAKAGAVAVARAAAAAVLREKHAAQIEQETDVKQAIANVEHDAEQAFRKMEERNARQAKVLDGLAHKLAEERSKRQEETDEGHRTEQSLRAQLAAEHEKEKEEALLLQEERERNAKHTEEAVGRAKELALVEMQKKFDAQREAAQMRLLKAEADGKTREEKLHDELQAERKMREVEAKRVRDLKDRIKEKAQAARREKSAIKIARQEKAEHLDSVLHAHTSVSGPGVEHAVQKASVQDLAQQYMSPRAHLSTLQIAERDREEERARETGPPGPWPQEIIRTRARGFGSAAVEAARRDAAEERRQKEMKDRARDRAKEEVRARELKEYEREQDASMHAKLVAQENEDEHLARQLEEQHDKSRTAQGRAASHGMHAGRGLRPGYHPHMAAMAASGGHRMAAVAHALGFSSASAYQQHRAQSSGGWQEGSASAPAPHKPVDKEFYNSGLSADKDVQATSASLSSPAAAWLNWL